MTHPRKFVRIARKLSISRDGGSSSSITEKGHFVVYTMDGRRFMIPLGFLNSTVFKELLRMSEDVFGFPSSCRRRITLPCDAVFLEYVVSLVEGGVPEIVEKALVVSIANAFAGCSSSS
ncbi:hypothetical protein ACLOJK_002317 [Asimina triloba]